MKIINEDASRPSNRELVKFILQNDFTEDDIKQAMSVIATSRDAWSKLSSFFSENAGPNSCRTPDGHPEMTDFFGPEEEIILGISGDIDNPSSDTVCVFVSYSEDKHAFVSEFNYSKGELPKAISLANELSDKISEDYDEERVKEVCKSLGMKEDY